MIENSYVKGLVRIVKIIKMSMQKKKNYAQEIHEPRWRRKKERFTLLFYLSKKTYWFYLVCSIDIPERE